MNDRRLLFVVTEDWYFWSHRRHLALAAIEAGWHVGLAARVSAHEERIRDLGVELFDVPWDRGGLNPLAEWRNAQRIDGIARRWSADVVHNVALKPVLNSAMRWRRLPAVNAITGLGYLFAGGSGRSGLLQGVVKHLLARALNRSGAHTVVQNSDDAEIAASLQRDGARRVHLIEGAGLDLATYELVTPPRSGPVRFAMVSRMLWDKGVGELVEAARVLRDSGVDAVVELVGSPDPHNRACVPDADLARWRDEGLIEWHGWSDDVREVWKRSHVAVLPSYREGLPKALLEAAACGRPMVATDVPGCRAVVQDGVNGLLVPARNAPALAAAMTRLANDAALRSALGAAARTQCEQRFSMPVIADAFHQLYAHMLREAGRA